MLAPAAGRRAGRRRRAGVLSARLDAPRSPQPGGSSTRPVVEDPGRQQLLLAAWAGCARPAARDPRPAAPDAIHTPTPRRGADATLTRSRGPAARPQRWPRRPRAGEASRRTNWRIGAAATAFALGGSGRQGVAMRSPTPPERRSCGPRGAGTAWIISLPNPPPRQKIQRWGKARWPRILVQLLRARLRRVSHPSCLVRACMRPLVASSHHTHAARAGGCTRRALSPWLHQGPVWA